MPSSLIITVLAAFLVLGADAVLFVARGKRASVPVLVAALLAVCTGTFIAVTLFAPAWF